jgi:hypothetical protein
MKPMVKAVTMVGLLFAAAVAVPFACSPFGGASAFNCVTDADCQGAGQGQAGGRCELSTNFCAFPDDSCGPLGRYGSLAGGNSGECVEGGSPDDAMPDTQEPDGPPVNPEDECFGSTGGLVEPCFAPTDVPAGAVILTADINTDDTSGLCSTTVKNTTACVVAGGTISIANGVTIRATGTKPLVLLATAGAITINGTLDAASHVGLPTPPPPAASANFAGCDAGTLPNNGGGGAGGSFGSLGGNGGIGRSVAASNGVAGATQTADALRGGCPGQDGNGAANFGIGGAGGGAVYLISTTSINVGVTGSINASGAGALNGFIGGSVGGGGGGSGGLIGLDAPAITNAGNVFANGGGGGEGSGNSNPATRTLVGCGDDPTGIGAALGGGGQTTNGANGSAGGAGAANGTAGLNNPNLNTGGGGGGGGGTGVIRVFGGTLAGNVSPPPS